MKWTKDGFWFSSVEECLVCLDVAGDLVSEKETVHLNLKDANSFSGTAEQDEHLMLNVLKKRKSSVLEIDWLWEEGQ